jgi:hypothetical protein
MLKFIRPDINSVSKGSLVNLMNMFFIINEHLAKPYTMYVLCYHIPELHVIKQAMILIEKLNQVQMFNFY